MSAHHPDNRRVAMRHSPITLVILTIALCVFAQPVNAALYGQSQINNLYENEDVGLRFYEAGRFDEAFSLLEKTAALGLKRSQYVLGFMFMKGEGVAQNRLIGLAWMGLATEAEEPEWQANFDRLYGSLNDAQKAMVDDKIHDYRRKFGARAQGITCARSAPVGSRRVTLNCRKSTGAYEDVDIETPGRN